VHPFQHFRLKRPPFEAAPDPRMFCATEPHAEARATLEYAIYSRKPCTVLVGESGTGKTLLARMMAATASLQATVLWLHGLGQPETHTELHVFARGALCGGAPSRPPTLTAFSEWLRDQSRASPSTVLIVDNADTLPPHGWRDVLILLSREVLFAEPVRIGLFGAPVLLRRLEAPQMVQIRRRIFRTAVLQPLTRREICAYIGGRLAAAGGRLEDIFASDALDQVHRLTRGVPAAINQVCENAMLEAISTRRALVSAADVLAAAEAMEGRRRPLQTMWKRVTLLNEPQLRLTALLQRCAAEPVKRLPPLVSSADAASGSASPLAKRAAAASPQSSVPQQRRHLPAAPHFVQQLQQLEHRLQHAFVSMQRACAAGTAAVARARQAELQRERPALAARLPDGSASAQQERSQSAD
jgi:type II secretory pathway predicted ATPase ExeA